MEQLIQEGVGHRFSLFSLYIFPKAACLPLLSHSAKACHSLRAAGAPYPQSWVQIESSVEQLIIIVILVLPLADNLVDGGGKANESCRGRRGADSKTPWVP